MTVIEIVHGSGLQYTLPFFIFTGPAREADPKTGFDESRCVFGSLEVTKHPKQAVSRSSEHRLVFQHPCILGASSLAGIDDQ